MVPPHLWPIGSTCSFGRTPESAMLPFRRFSLHESLNADLFVLAVKEVSKGDGFDFDSVRQPFIKRCADGLLAHSKRMRRFGPDSAGHVHDRMLKLLRRDHVVNQSDSMRLFLSLIHI